jgi:hypothetical protein
MNPCRVGQDRPKGNSWAVISGGNLTWSKTSRPTEEREMYTIIGNGFFELLAEFVRGVAHDHNAVAEYGLPAVLVIAAFSFIVWASD